MLRGGPAASAPSPGFRRSPVPHGVTGPCARSPPLPRRAAPPRAMPCPRTGVRAALLRMSAGAALPGGDGGPCPSPAESPGWRGLGEGCPELRSFGPASLPSPCGFDLGSCPGSLRRGSERRRGGRRGARPPPHLSRPGWRDAAALIPAGSSERV